jgi:UDP-2-acetamido-2-deoxy-ribo-hexuluronate aminotransferase
MIPMLDLKKQFDDLREEMLSAITEVIESTRYVLGPRVHELEAQVAKYTGVPFGVGVASGTDALHLAVKSLGLGKGDEVITTPFTFFATVESIIYEGATPVFVDIESDTFNIDPKKIEEKITKRTKAIIPVHIFGHPAEMDAIVDIAARHKLMVIEDCAQAFGATYKGKRVGSFGDAGCYSFYPSKNLGAYGDGGMIVLKSDEIAADIQKFRNHGTVGQYLHADVGVNSRLDEVQAAVLLVKMKHIDRYNALRREKAALFSSLMGSKVACPVVREGCEHVYHQYTIRSPKRDTIQEKLKEVDIASNVYYPVPMHMQPALAYLGYKDGDLPEAERAAREVLSLPIYPELAEKDIQLIADVILKNV